MKWGRGESKLLYTV